MHSQNEPLTFYHRQVLALQETLYARAYLWERIRQSRRFMDTHFQERIDLGTMAREACLSKFHFIRLFKNYYGRTPCQYLTEVRMARAKRLLQMGVPVTDVCFGIGFTSITSFTGLFKKITGITPAAYQRRRSYFLKKSNIEEGR